MISKFVGLALLALTLSACAVPATAVAEAPAAAETSSDEPDSGDPAGPPLPTAAEKAACTKLGGEMQSVGLQGFYACVIPSRDAGKTCANDADCAGQCWVSQEIPAGPNTQVRGQCQPTNLSYGCHTSLDKGVVAPEMCVE